MMLTQHTRPVRRSLALVLAVAGAAGLTAGLGAQARTAVESPAPPPTTNGVTPPPDYVIGPNDVLAIQFWREQELSADEVIVRPDGIVTLPLINEVQAAGLTPEQLRQTLEERAGRYVQNPNATVVVKQINSRQVFITGQVSRPGPYPLTAVTTVLQLIAQAGGLLEFADSKKIVVLRTEPDGRTRSFRFNYREVAEGKNLQQNIVLQPGDTVVVPD